MNISCFRWSPMGSYCKIIYLFLSVVCGSALVSERAALVQFVFGPGSGDEND